MDAPEPVDDPVGPVPAPPIVRGLLDPHPDVDVVAGYAQWTALRVDGLGHDALVTGVQAVLDHHDALRLRAADGLETLPRGLVRAVVGEFCGEDVTALARRLAGELDPRSGDLLRAALLRTDDGTPDRLVVVVHHLAMDGVSWRILLPDLHTACTGGTLARSARPGGGTPSSSPTRANPAHGAANSTTGGPRSAPRPGWVPGRWTPPGTRWRPPTARSPWPRPRPPRHC